MIQAKTYIDLRGNPLDVSKLDDEECVLIEELQSFAKKHPDAKTAEYWNFFVRRVGDFYDARGLTRQQITKTTVWRIAQDINGRLMIESGTARRGDYRDELELLILKNYPSRRAFCEATGLSEDMLSHVLSKRKHMGIQTLAQALAKIGYSIHIAPAHQ
jgi:hypothetical protein